LKAGVPVAESAYPLIVYVAFGDSFILLARYDKFTMAAANMQLQQQLANAQQPVEVEDTEEVVITDTNIALTSD